MSHNKRGFTLVELMLSMAFISMMLIAIAMCVIQMSTIYTRGETLRQVNQSSRVVATDLRRTFGEAQVSAINIAQAQSHQRLCTGQFTYVWTDAATAGDVGNMNRYLDAAAGEIRFTRIVDMGGQYCRTGDASPNVNTPIDAATANPVELLEEGDRALRVRGFTVQEAGRGDITGQRLYTIRILLGTDTSEAIDVTNQTCSVGSGSAESDINYCAVNEFTLTVRAGMG